MEKRLEVKKSWSKIAFHMVSAWSCESNMVLGQLRVNEKSNEITAIPKLIDLLEIENCIITIDAMGWQTEIADKIIEKSRLCFSCKNQSG